MAANALHVDASCIPATPAQVAATVRHCRALVRRRATFAAGVSMVPLPGLDLVTDVGVLTSVLHDINRAFGLTPEQIDALAPHQRVVVYQAVTMAGGALIGKWITRDVVLQMLKVVGVRLSTQQATKWVPIAGQALSAALTFGALKHVCEKHIAHCVEVTNRVASLPVAAMLERTDSVDDASH